MSDTGYSKVNEGIQFKDGRLFLDKDTLDQYPRIPVTDRSTIVIEHLGDNYVYTGERANRSLEIVEDGPFWVFKKCKLELAYVVRRIVK